MNSKAKAKIKNYIILTIVLIAHITLYMSICAIAEEMFNWLVPLLASFGVLWWFAEANQ